MRKFPFPAAGFTLIELMIVVVIATILAMIAIPSYQSQIRKSRRTEAKTALLDLAAREERYMATNGTYTADNAQLGYGNAFPQQVGSGYYRIETILVNASTSGTATTNATPATFALTATAIGPQATDAQCAQFFLNQAGNQMATTATCWN